MAAIGKAEGNASFAAKYWPLLQRWAEYLREKGLDPENQLSTDDLAGQLAHNANLTIKPIDALGAYAHMALGVGDTATADKYDALAKQMAGKWQEKARDGDHY